MTEELGGKRIVHELRPGGKNIPVTNENKLHYVQAMADFKLNRQVCYLAHILFCISKQPSDNIVNPADTSFFKCIL